MPSVFLTNEPPIQNLVSLIRQYRSANSSPDPLTVSALPLVREPARPPKTFDKTVPRSSKCFQCNRPGHFARDCPYALVPKKSLLENGLTMTFNTEQEDKLPVGTKFIRALALHDEENDEESPEETYPEIDPNLCVRALNTIQTRDKPLWIKRDIRIEIRLSWLDRPLFALFDCGADVTVFNAAFSEGAKMLNIPLPTVLDASNRVLPFLGVSRETLLMGKHSFPALWYGRPDDGRYLGNGHHRSLDVIPEMVQLDIGVRAKPRNSYPLCQDSRTPP